MTICIFCDATPNDRDAHNDRCPLVSPNPTIRMLAKAILNTQDDIDTMLGYEDDEPESDPPENPILI